MQILQEEIFGPVIPVRGCESVDEAIRYIGKRDKPLALYIYSNNQQQSALRRGESERHGQLSRELRFQGVLP
jgi:acyl-CoA reductase-like NAD-dependent aldehyde dehydrogenase